MSKKLWKRILLGALLLGIPSAVWAYVVCMDVVTVYPNGVTYQCKICEIYDNTTHESRGEISTCDASGQPRMGPV